MNARDPNSIGANLRPVEFDVINKAAHYNQGPMKCVKCGHPIECIDIVKWFNFMLGNCIKYIWRNTYKHKQIEDLKKARYYLDAQIKQLEEENNLVNMPRHEGVNPDWSKALEAKSNGEAQEEIDRDRCV